MPVKENELPMLVVAAAVHDAAGAVLMHCRPAGKAHAGLWEFPGGKVEPGEDVRTALVREIDEETGLQLDQARIAEAGFAITRTADGMREIAILLFETAYFRGKAEEREGGTLRCCSPSDILQLDLAPADRKLAERLFETE